MAVRLGRTASRGRPKRLRSYRIRESAGARSRQHRSGPSVTHSVPGRSQAQRAPAPVWRGNHGVTTRPNSRGCSNTCGKVSSVTTPARSTRSSSTTSFITTSGRRGSSGASAPAGAHTCTRRRGRSTGCASGASSQIGGSRQLRAAHTADPRLGGTVAARGHELRLIVGAANSWSSCPQAPTNVVTTYRGIASRTPSPRPHPLRLITDVAPNLAVRSAEACLVQDRDQGRSSAVPLAQAREVLGERAEFAGRLRRRSRALENP
jgi:hypothetical protein